MRTRKGLTTGILLSVLGVLLVSCTSAGAPTPTGKAPSQTREADKPVAKTGPDSSPPALTPKPAAGKPNYGGILTSHINDDPRSFDIHQETTSYLLKFVGSIYNGLLQYDPLDNDKVILDLAERWERNSDGTVYTFYLQRGVRWHDGKPFTAEDARYSLDRIRKPPRGTISPRAAVFESVANVEALDETTLRVTLRSATASFISNMATGWMVIMPKHMIESKGDMKKDALGTGPFKLKEYSPGAVYAVGKNADYFVQGRPYLDGIKFYVIRDRQMRLAALRTGQVLISETGSTGISVSQAAMLEKEMPDKVSVQRAPSLNFHSFMMNSKAKPWDDLVVRKAANMAIDRTAAINILDEGDGDSGGLMPPGGQWAFPLVELAKMPGYRADKAAELAEAKNLLAGAGFAGGFSTTILVRAGSDTQNLAVFVQSQLEKIGIRATLAVKELAAFNTDMDRRAFTTTSWPHAASSDDPDSIFGEHYISAAGRNYQGVSNPKVDELFVQQSRTLDPDARRKLVIDMQRHAMEDYGKLALFWKRERQGVWLKVKNYKVGYGVYNNNKYQDVWLAE